MTHLIALSLLSLLLSPPNAPGRQTAAFGADGAATGVAPEATFGAASGVQDRVDELRLSAPLIENLLRVIYFGKEGRVHLREYSTCSYEFIQDPSVSTRDGLVVVSAEFYRRRGTQALGGCLGSPGVNTTVVLSARPRAQGSSIGIEILEIKTQELPELTSIILNLAGVTVPMTYEFNLMSAMNRMLHSQQPFGISSLEIREVVVAEDSVLLRLNLQFGLW